MSETPSSSITITVNGKRAEGQPAGTVAEFLRSRGLQDKMVAVELNGKILARHEFSLRHLRDGDQIEVVHFVGGG